MTTTGTDWSAWEAARPEWDGWEAAHALLGDVAALRAEADVSPDPKRRRVLRCRATKTEVYIDWLVSWSVGGTEMSVESWRDHQAKAREARKAARPRSV